MPVIRSWHACCSASSELRRPLSDKGNLSARTGRKATGQDRDRPDSRATEERALVRRAGSSDQGGPDAFSAHPLMVPPEHGDDHRPRDLEPDKRWGRGAGTDRVITRRNAGDPSRGHTSGGSLSILRPYEQW